MKTLVVPVNFTDNASNAARYAADLARAIEAEVYLLHVLDLGYAFQQSERKGRKLLCTLKEELTERTHGKITIITDLQLDNILTGIEKVCRRAHPFMVVMGAEDTTFHAGFTYHNVANAVGHLPYPLLVVPAGAVFHPIRRIALACDWEDIAAEMPISPDLRNELKRSLSCRYEVVHVTGKNQVPTLAGYPREDSPEDTCPEVHFVQSPEVEEGILQYLKQRPADWLMVFPKKHNVLEFHNSHAKRIAADCPVPVLSVLTCGSTIRHY